MIQDYKQLTAEQHELLEKQTQRVVVQALQEYSQEAKDIFDSTNAQVESEITPLAEDLTQYALEVAECYPINKRFAGFIDYKRVRWMSTPFGIIPQVLLVDAKASTENNRETLQQSQLCMDADFEVTDKTGRPKIERLNAGVPPHQILIGYGAKQIPVVTTSIFVHFFYEDISSIEPPYRRLIAINSVSMPHQRFKPKYNQDPRASFFGQGKHSSARQEKQRIRVYYERLKAACPWRLQELKFENGVNYATPRWRDTDLATGAETLTAFDFFAR
ncbi:MAG TPA: SfiI family type II restriction endonuclease [Elusimicrobiota bacterium]|nr:SfiI family type II restriction endonuclease [Elusimicrobiota bacterium]